jgi:hypothetical protein
MKHSNPNPTTDVRESRQLAKKKRKKGLLYLKEKGIEINAWAKQNDPLWGIKGIARHLKTRPKKLPKWVVT